ncbi:MAG: branched-chain amino acid ABC transporter permease [Proteobacteria bacterium]|nr:branched-chain amino acid ABC transporter permease [Pseudomonadota bacterium]
MKRGYLGFLLFLACLVVFPLIFTNPFPRHLLIMIMMFATMTIGWNIISGYAGQISFGNAAFFGMGAYTSAILLTKFGINPWLGMIAGCILSVILAIIIGYPCFRLKGHYFAIATIAVGEMMMVLFSAWDFVGAAVGIYLPILDESFKNFEFHTTKIPYYYIILCIFLLGLGVSYLVEKSRLGFYFRAIKDDPDGARSVGINIQKYKMYAFCLSAILTSICGTFYAQYVLYIDPSSTIALMAISIPLCIIALIGGIGKLFGPVVGAFVFIPLIELTRVYLGSQGQGIDLIIYSLLMIVIAILRPQGLWGVFSKGVK